MSPGGVEVVMEPVDGHPFPPDVSLDGGDLGPERVLVTPDGGFATFADNPVASAGIAEACCARSSRPSSARGGGDRGCGVADGGTGRVQ
jgi:hypothetical protein